MIEAAPELGFPIDTYFTDEVFIERKNSLQELAQSLYGQKKKRTNGKSEYDDAFRRELKRAINKKHKYLLILNIVFGLILIGTQLYILTFF